MTDLPKDLHLPTKEELERQKLSLEIKYVHRTFLVQALNASALVAIAIIVFIFFQRPQLDQMAETRAALELQHVENTLVGIFNLKNDSDKKLMLDNMYKQHPRFDYLGTLAKSFEAKPEPMKNTTEPINQKCAEVRAEVDKQQSLLSELEGSMNAELRGLKTSPQNTGMAGQGPVYKFLSERRNATKSYLAVLESQLQTAKCN